MTQVWKFENYVYNIKFNIFKKHDSLSENSADDFPMEEKIEFTRGKDLIIKTHDESFAHGRIGLVNSEIKNNKMDPSYCVNIRYSDQRALIGSMY